jgi:hypothetical protein
MDQIDHQALPQSQVRVVDWLGMAGIVLSFIGSWLVLGALLAGIIAGQPPNQNVLYCGLLLCGLGGSLFVKFCFFYEQMPRVGIWARVRHWVKLALVLILATVFAPFLAAWAFGFGALVTFIFVYSIIAYNFKKLLDLGFRQTGMHDRPETDRPSVN